MALRYKKSIIIQLDQVIIYLLFGFLLILVIASVGVAFSSIHQESIRIQELIDIVKRDANKDTFARELEVLILKFEALSSKTIDSQTMSFIFQILSATLIAIGVYVIRRTNKNSVLAINKTKQIAKIGDTNWDESNINAWLLFALQSSFSLRSDASNESQIPILRDNLVECKNLLERAMDDERGFPDRHIRRFSDISVRTRERLKKVKLELEEYIQNNPGCGFTTTSFPDLIDTCEQIIDIIKNDGFKRNYEKIKNILDEEIDTSL